MKSRLDVQVRGKAVVIGSRVPPREGWAKMARRMRAQGDDRLIDEPTQTRFDDEKWRWR